jgi:hypothetical protein
MDGCGLDFSGSREKPVAGTFEHGNAPPGRFKYSYFRT